MTAAGERLLLAQCEEEACAEMLRMKPAESSRTDWIRARASIDKQARRYRETVRRFREDAHVQAGDLPADPHTGMAFD
jgi:hypothetical protein